MPDVKLLCFQEYLSDIVGHIWIIVGSMKANKLVTRIKSRGYSDEQSTMYEAYGKDEMLVCCISEGAVDSFSSYSAQTGKLVVMDSYAFDLLSIEAEAEIRSAESFLKGKADRLVIFTDKPSEAILLAATLFTDKTPDYFISLDSTTVPNEIEYRFNEIVLEKDKGELLCRCLSVFKKKKSVIITADDISQDVVSLLCTSAVNCIAIVPPFSGKAVAGMPLVQIKSIKATMGKGL